MYFIKKHLQNSLRKFYNETLDELKSQIVYV